MGLISSGIDTVRVFDIPGGISADGKNVGLPRVALVKWCSKWSDKLHQVYVNGQYAGTTLETGQRYIVVQVLTSSEVAVQIEVFAVETNEADRNFSSEFDLRVRQSGRVKMSLLRSQNLPVSSSAHVYFDGGTGQVDYNKPLTAQPIQIWPNWQDKAGFGMSRFGTGDFGFDWAGGVGFGKGLFGHGRFGIDSDKICWVSPELQVGVYKFAIKIFDEAGHESGAVESREVTVIPAASPAESMNISSFEKETNELVLDIVDVG